MSTATEIVLVYVMPALGMLTANFMFAAPVKDVRRAVRSGTLGSLNPTPWAVMTGNCTGWVTYSYLLQNQFVFWANAPGLVVSVWLNMAAAKLQYCDRISTSLRSSFVRMIDSNRRSFALRSPGEKIDLGDPEGGDEGGNEGDAAGADAERRPSPAPTFAQMRKMALEITIQKTEAPAPHEKVVVGVVASWIAVISLLSFLNLNTEQWKMVVGIVVNVNLCFFYGAPLSTIFTVLKTRDSSSIHKWTMLMNTANGCFWAAFGFGTMDWFILVPNGLGAILGFVQMFLRAAFPSRGAVRSDSAAEGASSTAAPEISTEDTCASTNNRSRET